MPEKADSIEVLRPKLSQDANSILDPTDIHEDRQGRRSTGEDAMGRIGIVAVPATCPRILVKPSRALDAYGPITSNTSICHSRWSPGFLVERTRDAICAGFQSRDPQSDRVAAIKSDRFDTHVSPLRRK